MCSSRNVSWGSAQTAETTAQMSQIYAAFGKSADIKFGATRLKAFFFFFFFNMQEKNLLF